MYACGVDDNDDKPLDFDTSEITEEFYESSSSAAESPVSTPSESEKPIVDTPQEQRSAPTPSKSENTEDSIAEERLDPDIIVEHWTSEQDSSIPTPDPSAPLGSAENPIAEEPQAQ